MKASASQEQKIREWAAEGLSLNEIHKRIGQELGLPMTYMEARLLVAGLQVSLKDRNPAPVPAANPVPEADALDGEEPIDDEETGAGDLPAGGKLRLGVDAIARPGMLASGQVTFSDGAGGRWSIDQAGRLGLETDKPGYRPSETDAVAFQRELQMALHRAGYL
jgi:hypothetical protein